MSAPALQPTALPPKANVGNAIDLEKMPIDKVIAQLAVEPGHGLSSAEAQRRLAKYGPNALIEKEINLAHKIVGLFTGPIAYMIEAAAIVSAVIGHWSDFAIMVLPEFERSIEKRQPGYVHYPVRTLFLLAAISGDTAFRRDPPYPDRGMADVRLWFARPVDLLDFDRLVLVYNIAWTFVLGGVRLIAERFAAHRTARDVRSAHMVSQSLMISGKCWSKTAQKS